MKINAENWTYTHFTNQNLRAFISIGAALAETEEVEMQYLVTLTDQDYQEIFQSIHLSLESALETINAKYGGWVAENGLAPKGDGCSSCAAH